MTSPDPRSPLVIDLRDTRRGEVMVVDRVVPAPGDLGVALATIPEGSDLHLDLDVQSMSEGVFVRGTATATVHAECGRCLEPMVWDEQVDVTEFFRDPSVSFDAADDSAESDDPVLEGDLLDLEPTVRDAVVLRLPLSPVCRPDCPGLCPQCGVRLADDPAHHHEDVDPRWAGLAGLLDDDSRGQR